MSTKTNANTNASTRTTSARRRPNGPTDGRRRMGDAAIRDRGEPPSARDTLAISWCALEDVRHGVDQDDPWGAIVGWHAAGVRAAQHVGRDPLVTAIDRVGPEAATRIYQRARTLAMRGDAVDCTARAGTC